MIVRSFEEIAGSDRDVAWGNGQTWRSISASREEVPASGAPPPSRRCATKAPMTASAAAAANIKRMKKPLALRREVTIIPTKEKR